MNTVTIRTSSKGTGYYVRTSYNVKALDAWRAIPGRKFDRTSGENFIPLEQRRALWNLLRTYYAGETLVTDLVGTIGPIPQSFASDQWRAEVQQEMDKELDEQVSKVSEEPRDAEIVEANGWAVVDLPAVHGALSKRASRKPKAKRRAAARP